MSPTVGKPEIVEQSAFQGHLPALPAALVDHYAFPFRAGLRIMFEFGILQGRPGMCVYVKMIGEILGHEIVL